MFKIVKLRLRQTSRLVLAKYRSNYSFSFEIKRISSISWTPICLSDNLLKRRLCSTIKDAQPPISPSCQVPSSVTSELTELKESIKQLQISLWLYGKQGLDAIKARNEEDVSKYELLVKQTMEIIQGMGKERDRLMSLSGISSSSSSIPSLTLPQHQVNETNCGDHTVKEYLKYIPREAEAIKIVHLMKERQTRRSGCSSPMDKSNNRLIAILGSPGSGKSTFLKHFPTSQAYREYIAEKMLTAEPSIDSSITFNGGMSGTVDALGLRIIYGALAAMGLLDVTDFTWDNFFVQFSSLSGLTARNAVKFLQEIFGLSRPILLLIDGLVEANDKEGIMKQLGSVLNRYGNCDVIVSSLSPTFVKDLLKSRRLVEYVILDPLLDARLGKEECFEWANIMIHNAGGVDKVDHFMQAVLRKLYLLYGGHPRSIQIMVDMLKVIENWRYFDSDIGNRDSSKIKLLFNLLEKLPEYNSDLSDLSEEVLNNYVFSTRSVFPVGDPIFRQLVEAGKLSLHELLQGDRFLTYVQCISFLKCLPTKTYKTSKMVTVQKFLNCFRECSNADTLWERVVALNIINQSGANYSYVKDFLGISVINVDFISSNWNIKVEKMEDYDIQSPYNCLVLPSKENHPGNAGSLHLFNEDLNIRYRFFLQMQISAPNELLDVVTSMICHNILEAIRGGTSELANTHMILYIWNISDINSDLIEQGKTTVLSKLSGVIKTITDNAIKDKMNIPAGFEENVRSFIIDYYDSNIHAIKRLALRKWLSPSLLPIPLILTEIE